MFAVFLAVIASASASDSRLHPSPFLPPPGDPSGPVASAAAKDSLEFTGVIVTGQTVLLNLTDTQAKKSFWIGVGKSENDVEAVDYDRRQDAAILKVRGETKRLVMKQPVVVASSGTSAATVPIAPVVPLPPPSTPAEAEREARMLVSDLLEIGMQQRKAYEEAQRKAALEATKTNAAPLPVTPAQNAPGLVPQP
jgi:hypothetical protein